LNDGVEFLEELEVVRVDRVVLDSAQVVERFSGWGGSFAQRVHVQTGTDLANGDRTRA